MKYLHIRIVELLEEKKISKTRICKDLDLQRGNFNRYCRDEFQRIDSNLIIKLCEYLDCNISDLLEIKEKQQQKALGDLMLFVQYPGHFSKMYCLIQAIFSF